MTDATTQAALSLLERLRTLAETWMENWPPGIARVDSGAVLSGSPEGQRAYRALSAVDYYGARGRTEMLARLGAAIKALKGETM